MSDCGRCNNKCDVGKDNHDKGGCFLCHGKEGLVAVIKKPRTVLFCAECHKISDTNYILKCIVCESYELLEKTAKNKRGLESALRAEIDDNEVSLIAVQGCMACASRENDWVHHA